MTQLQQLGTGQDGGRSPICVVGAGTMGRGIAQVAVAAGHPVSLVDPDRGQLDGGRRRHPRPAATQAPRDRRRPWTRGCAPPPRSATSPPHPAHGRHRGGRGEPRRQGVGLRARPRALRRGRHPGHEHLLAVDHRDRGPDRRPVAGGGHALLQPGARHAPGRGRQRGSTPTRWPRRPSPSWPRPGARSSPTCSRHRASSSTAWPGRSTGRPSGWPRRGAAPPETIDEVAPRGGRVPDGPVRADGPHRQRRELHGHRDGVARVPLRPPLRAVADAARARRRGQAGPQGGPRLLLLPPGRRAVRCRSPPMPRPRCPTA